MPDTGPGPCTHSLSLSFSPIPWFPISRSSERDMRVAGLALRVMESAAVPSTLPTSNSASPSLRAWSRPRQRAFLPVDHRTAVQARVDVDAATLAGVDLYTETSFPGRPSAGCSPFGLAFAIALRGDLRISLGRVIDLRRRLFLLLPRSGRPVCLAGVLRIRPRAAHAPSTPMRETPTPTAA